MSIYLQQGRETDRFLTKHIESKEIVKTVQGAIENLSLPFNNDSAIQKFISDTLMCTVNYDIHKNMWNKQHEK